ncbi:glycosyltransferase family 4 protein [Pseudomonas sp. B14(2017)]|uniref:glycosyltransferase family 4 protein n=1 Tax=Pseudomonas sp. B14(2017) TaxID=1981745 RepID=UPI000A1FD50B|nr:glycosyltransferase family 4 protein [Pseudomonas sp. B14(2017)]
MTKVSMIVWNEFLNDARVMKEAQTLQRAGYKVRVFALHTPGVTQEHTVLPDGIEVVRVARSPLWKLRNKNVRLATKAAGKASAPSPIKPSLKLLLLRAIARGWTHFALLLKMLEYRAPVVHSHDVNTLPTAWMAAKLSRSKLVYDAHEISTSREGYKSLRKVVGFVEKWLMPSANGTITTTDARAKYFARAYGVERPLVLQNRPRLVESPRSNKIRDELGLVESWPIVVYQGGLQQGRGLEKLVRCAQHVSDCYFVLIGGGRLTQPLMELAEKLNIRHKVHFIPTVALAELPAYTASADIGLQPIENTCLNHYTTDSNKLFEYVIAGLPVIATDFPEIRKIVRNNEIGILVPANDEQALIDAIVKLLNDRDLCERFSNNAKRTARNLNWETQEKCLIDLYERVLLTPAQAR